MRVCGLQTSCAMGTTLSVGACQAARWGLLSRPHQLGIHARRRALAVKEGMVKSSFSLNMCAEHTGS